jgi:hypothetical protein
MQQREGGIAVKTLLHSVDTGTLFVHRGCLYTAREERIYRGPKKKPAREWHKLCLLPKNKLCLLPKS